jgi:hypothetical protein
VNLKFFFWVSPNFDGVHGHAHLFAFPPSQQGLDRFVNRRGNTGLVGFADPDNPIRAPLGRFWVGLMAGIPARENFKNTKASKTSKISLGPSKRKVVGKGQFGLVDFLPDVRK